MMRGCFLSARRAVGGRSMPRASDTAASSSQRPPRRIRSTASAKRPSTWRRSFPLTPSAGMGAGGCHRGRAGPPGTHLPAVVRAARRRCVAVRSNSAVSVGTVDAARLRQSVLVAADSRELGADADADGPAEEQAAGAIWPHGLQHDVLRARRVIRRASRARQPVCRPYKSNIC